MAHWLPLWVLMIAAVCYSESCVKEIVRFCVFKSIQGICWSGCQPASTTTISFIETPQREFISAHSPSQCDSVCQCWCVRRLAGMHFNSNPQGFCTNHTGVHRVAREVFGSIAPKSATSFERQHQICFLYRLVQMYSNSLSPSTKSVSLSTIVACLPARN